MSSLSDHPTVKRFWEKAKATPDKTESTILDAQWLTDRTEYLKDVVRPLQEKEETVYVVGKSDAEDYVAGSATSEKAHKARWQHSKLLALDSRVSRWTAVDVSTWPI